MVKKNEKNDQKGKLVRFPPESVEFWQFACKQPPIPCIRSTINWVYIHRNEI